jgi:hypothetical protein
MEPMTSPWRPEANILLTRRLAVCRRTRFFWRYVLHGQRGQEETEKNSQAQVQETKEENAPQEQVKPANPE